MNPAERDAALKALKEKANCFEVYERTTFVGYRHPPRAGGPVQEVLIEVLDAGPDDPYRWHVSATDEEGRAATGNAADDLEVVMSTVHWWELDTDRSPPEA